MWRDQKNSFGKNLENFRNKFLVTSEWGWRFFKVICKIIKDLIGKTTFVKKYTFRGKSAFWEIESCRITWHCHIWLVRSATIWKKRSKNQRFWKNNLCLADKGSFSGKTTYVRLTKVVFPGTTCSVITILLAVLSWLWSGLSLTYKKHSIGPRVNSFK